MCALVAVTMEAMLDVNCGQPDITEWNEASESNEATKWNGLYDCGTNVPLMIGALPAQMSNPIPMLGLKVSPVVALTVVTKSNQA